MPIKQKKIVKRLFSVLLLALCIAGAYKIIIYPLLFRGTVYITIKNDTSETLTVQSISGETVNQLIEAGEKRRLAYEIGSRPDISIDFDSTLLVEPSSVEVDSYVEPAYYGSAKVIVTYNEDTQGLDYEIRSQIYF